MKDRKSSTRAIIKNGKERIEKLAANTGLSKEEIADLTIKLMKKPGEIDAVLRVMEGQENRTLNFRTCTNWE